MGKWKLRIVIILGIAFFLEGLLHNMKRFYVVFSGLTWGNGNLEYIFIHILLNEENMANMLLSFYLITIALHIFIT